MSGGEGCGIWTAADKGDLDRLKELVNQARISCTTECFSLFPSEFVPPTILGISYFRHILVFGSASRALL